MMPFCRRLLVCAVLLLAAGGGLQAQDKRPAFAGAWILDTARTAAANGRPPGSGSPPVSVVITQEGSVLKLVRKASQTTTIVYRLDGRDAENENAAARRTDVYRSKWEGAKLVTHIWADQPAGDPLVVETRSIDAASGEMVVETRRRTPDGAQVTTMVFKRESR